MATRRLLAAAIFTAATAHAAPQKVPLAPPAVRITFTSYAVGLFPLPGHFTRFTGILTIDPSLPDACTFMLNVEAASLSMASPARTRQALGAHLLDAAAFPRIVYRGSCAAGSATGTLTLHGTTRPFTLQIARQGATATAAGTLRRQDYGITGLSGLLGRTIAIGIAITLPPGLATP